MSRKYTVIYKFRPGRFYVCEDCSVIVRDTEQHQDWHQRLVDTMKMIVDIA